LATSTTCPKEQLYDTAWSIAEEIRDNAPITVRANKQLIYRAMDAGRQSDTSSPTS